MKAEDIKQALKKFWRFIWEDNSIWSWIVNIVLAFIIIKFLVYPGLGWILGTSHPIVAVISGSMEHDGDFDEWWLSEAKCDDMPCSQEKWYNLSNISKENFLKFPFKSGFNKGDIMVLVGKEKEEIETGNVVVYWSNLRKEPIIHRVIKITEGQDKTYLMTKGDHNIDSFDFESKIDSDKIVGKAVFRVPFLGYVKIWFLDLLRLVGIIR